MFEINNIHHSKFELSDFVEYKALSCADGTYSIEALRASLSAPEDEIIINGTEEGDDEVLSKLQEALAYCSVRRANISGYPCNISINSLSINNPIDRNAYLYFFLLLANRLNMQNERVQGGKDATKLFERLCRCVTSEYLGEHSKCEVLGTSVNGSFKDKVDDILNKLHILGQYEEPFGGTGHHKDGGVDLVAWIPFNDNKDSQIIALGQCKTGTTWEVYLKKVDFFGNYSSKQPFVAPQYMFFVAEDFGNDKWKERQDGGVLFDRRRILEYIPSNISDFDETLETDIIEWVNSAKEYIQG